MAEWSELADFLTALPAEDMAQFRVYAALDLPDDPEVISQMFEAYTGENPPATPASLLATAGAQAGAAGDLRLARRLGQVAVELSDTAEDRQLAHVSLAQTFFRDRRSPESLEEFIKQCQTAIRAGHTGTFCYERLAVLHEHRGEIESAVEICQRAIDVLERAGDVRSAARFRRRLERLMEKRKPH